MEPALLTGEQGFYLGAEGKETKLYCRGGILLWPGACCKKGRGEEGLLHLLGIYQVWDCG